MLCPAPIIEKQACSDAVLLIPPPIKVQLELILFKLPEAIEELVPVLSKTPNLLGIILLSLDPVL